MGFIDWIVVLTVIISVLFALYRGLLRELLGISSWILAGLTALYSYEPLYGLLLGKVENVKMWSLILCAGFALVILIIMTIVNAHITKSLRKSSLSGLDRILGLIFGVVRAILLIVLVWLFARQMAWTPKQIELMDKENISVQYIQLLSDYSEKLLPDSIQKNLQKPDHIKKEPVAEYKNENREKLTEMIEEMVEIEE